MKKLFVNDKEYEIDHTGVVCTETGICIGSNHEIEVSEDKEVYLEVKEDYVKILIS